MASKAREYIEKQRRLFRSPVEVQKDIDARYGADAEQKMSFKEARDVYDEAICWASWHDLAMQDYWALHCGHNFKWDEDNPKPIVKSVLDALREMADHLQHGHQLGLSGLEQRVLDTLWGWVPHDYQDNYVACSRDVSEAIVRLLPTETEERSGSGYQSYYDSVIREVKLLAEKYDVDFDTSEYNLTIGYFYEWLSEEYGIIFDDAWDRED